MTEKSKGAGPAQTTQREAWEAAQREAVQQAEPLRALLTREWLKPSSDVVR